MTFVSNSPSNELTLGYISERLEDVVQEVIAKYGIRRSESSSAADNTSECEDTSEIG